MIRSPLTFGMLEFVSAVVLSSVISFGQVVAGADSSHTAVQKSPVERVAEAIRQQDAGERIRLLLDVEPLCDSTLKNSELYPNLVDSYVVSGDLDDAIKVVQQMIAGGAGALAVADARVSVARGYLEAKQFRQAAEQLSITIPALENEIAAKSTSRAQQSLLAALELRAEVLLGQGDAKGALGVLRDCEERRNAQHMEPSARTAFEIARAQVRLGMQSEALTAFVRAYCLATHRVHAIYRHGKIAGQTAASEYAKELSEKEQLAAAVKTEATPVYGSRETSLDAYLAQQLANYDKALLESALSTADTRKLAPAFDLPTLTGEKVSLTSLRGKVVLLNFWETSCKPCRAEYPHLLKIQNDFSGTEVAVLMISLDDDLAEAQRFARKYGFAQHVLLKDGTVQRAYEVGPIPHTVIIDRSGWIRFKEVGFTLDSPQIFRAAIESLIGNHETENKAEQKQRKD